MNAELLVKEFQDLKRRYKYMMKYIEYLEGILGLTKIEQIVEMIGNFKYRDEKKLTSNEWLMHETQKSCGVSLLEKTNVQAKSEILKENLDHNYVYLEHLLYYNTTLKTFPILGMKVFEKKILSTLAINQKVLKLNNEIMEILIRSRKEALFIVYTINSHFVFKNSLKLLERTDANLHLKKDSGNNFLYYETEKHEKYKNLLKDLYFQFERVKHSTSRAENNASENVKVSKLRGSKGQRLGPNESGRGELTHLQ